jgi:hypothetical protein
MGPTNHTI